MVCSRAIAATQPFQFEKIGAVEIDESVEARRKYNRGRLVETKWVFGIDDRHEKCGIIKLVEDRSAETLIPIIQQYVVPGAVIHNDCWKAYNSLSSLGFRHFTVNHKQKFRNPKTPLQIWWRHIGLV